MGIFGFTELRENVHKSGLSNKLILLMLDIPVNESQVCALNDS